MSVEEKLDDARENLQAVVDVDEPTRSEEIDTFLGVSSIYDPFRDSMEIDPDVSDEEMMELEMDLIQKYVVDQVVGDTGLEEIDQLEDEVGLYHQIDSFSLFDNGKESVPDPKELEEDIEEVFEDYTGRDEDHTTAEEMDQISDEVDRLELERTRKNIGEDEELNRRLAVLKLSDRIEQVIQGYRQEYRDLEKRKRQVRDGYHRWDDEFYWNRLEDLIEDDDAREEVISIKTKLMEDEMEVIERTDELKDEDEIVDDILAGTDPLLDSSVSEMGTDYDRDDVEKALSKHGIEDEGLIDEVYSLMKKRDELDQQREQQIDEIHDREMEIYDDLRQELDEEAERLEDRISLFLEPVKQREWKLDTLPVDEVAESLKVLYKAHQDGLLEKEREEYEGKVEAFVDQNYRSPDQIKRYLDRMIDIYEMGEGSPEERLSETFERAPEYAS